MFKRSWPPDERIRSILMIKGHSAGIGDILRSSAAWRRLKERFPQADLHLLMLTKEPGYFSEAFIARHHLLASFKSIDKRTKGVAGWKAMYEKAWEFAAPANPGLIIDFEPNGTRTSLLAWLLGRAFKAPTLGVGEAPLRSLFYTRASESFAAFARRRNMPERLEYANRDFVALSALGIERNGAPIELAETPEATACRKAFRKRLGLAEDARLAGLVIGCGTRGAESRRPNMEVLSHLAAYLQTKHQLQLVVGVSAPFELPLDEQFMEIHRCNCSLPVVNAGVKMSLLENVGFINTCSIYISPDTGPYHMAVGLKTPTLGVFNRENSPHYHFHPWVKCVVAPGLEQLPALKEAADQLLREPIRNAAPA